MGYYIETGSNHFKDVWVVKNHGGIPASLEEAKEAIQNKEKGVIVVVDNSMFEAAAFAYDEDEFNDFHQLSDLRPKKYVILEREKAKELSKYEGK